MFKACRNGQELVKDDAAGATRARKHVIHLDGEKGIVFSTALHQSKDVDAKRVLCEGSALKL